MGRCDAQRSTVRIGSATRRPSHTPYCQASGEEGWRYTIFLSLSQPLSVPLSTTYLFFDFSIPPTGIHTSVQSARKSGAPARTRSARLAGADHSQIGLSSV